VTDDRPVDVRLAEALGYGSPEEIPELLTELWSHSYAWCGEVQELNDLTATRHHWGRWHAWQDGDGGTTHLSGAGDSWRLAICEWVIAAIAAGVRVVLPGGRVIEGRAV
jgi:hypothetical protein